MGVSDATIERKSQTVLSSGPEERVYGRAAVSALFKARSSSIIRVYLDERLVKDFGYILKWCAQKKKAYHLVGSAELEKISKSKHHEGVMVLVSAKPKVSQHEMLVAAATSDRPLILLDQVGNPHNLGAFVRTAAHFGVPYILTHGAPVSLSPSMARIAMGGLESVDLVTIDDVEFVSKRLHAFGYHFYGTSSHKGWSVLDVEMPKKCVFVFGNEVRGVSPTVDALCDDYFTIPGTGKVESLNVGVAAGITLSAYERCRMF